MLSNPLQRFSPYNNVPSSGIVSNDRLPPTHLQANGLESFGQGPHYTYQHLQQSVQSPGPLLARAGPHQKHRQNPYGAAGGKATGASGGVRRRISRACDQCNQLRTKCDGQHPCAHCLEFGLGCEYVRERKKRGKASRKDLAQAAAQAAAVSNSNTQNGDSSHSSDNSIVVSAPNGRTSPKHNTKGERGSSLYVSTESSDNAQNGSVEQIGEGTVHSLLMPQPTMDRQLETPSSLDMNGYGNLSNGYDRQGIGAQIMGNSSFDPQGGVSAYPELPYGLPSQSPTQFAAGSGFRLSGGPLSTYSLGGNAASPGWGVSMSSPTGQYRNGGAHAMFNHSQLRYPVLEPLLPHLENILPIALACDLIDLYFASSSSAQMHPMSAYVLGFVFRKKSFLHPTKPRRCQPALLASMLWVAAQTSDSPFLTSVPSGRGKVCQKLLELTVSLLKPLIHTPSGEASPATSPVAEGVALGGLGVALPGSISMNNLSGEFGAFGAAGSLDDVITYIHLATVVSASEYKGASLRWWNAAWSLARELKLGRELPPSETPLDLDDTQIEESIDEHDVHRNREGFVTEEEREERRRIWWLVYIVDRHLALCYNRPLFLLDIECDGLQHPMDDTIWQSGNFSAFTNGNTDPSILADSESEESRSPRGPSFECRGHSIFGYFLPLMTILGEIVDLHHARNHPRFGVAFRPGREWDDQADEITKHLQTYEQSLRDFQQRNLTRHPEENGHEGTDGLGVNNTGDHGTPHSVQTTSSTRMSEGDIQTRIVAAYGTHVMHVLHILLAGKWDPINLIDDNDLWISTQGFISATGQAVSAAEAISQILEFDPGLEFMPFFFGIYLLQGSFLLLLIADKLQFEASSNVVKACETIVRAHEACVVTLNTEYQRNFSKVMRSALAQVRGRIPEDLGEQHQRRRELLSLYRWTGDGTGLAL